MLAVLGAVLVGRSRGNRLLGIDLVPPALRGQSPEGRQAVEANPTLFERACVLILLQWGVLLTLTQPISLVRNRFSAGDSELRR